jgi:hypothetical protein
LLPALRSRSLNSLVGAAVFKFRQRRCSFGESRAIVRVTALLPDEKIGEWPGQLGLLRPLVQVSCEVDFR